MKRHKARESLFERLADARVCASAPDPLPTACWLWPGSICNKGYGMIRTAGVTKRVHIAAWELIKGRKVRAGYTLDHVCRNKACWRPSHMTEMTRAANTAKGNRDNPRSTEKANAARAERAREAQARKMLDEASRKTVREIHGEPDPRAARKVQHAQTQPGSHHCTCGEYARSACQDAWRRDGTYSKL
jgi:hypothetical protein